MSDPADLRRLRPPRAVLAIARDLEVAGFEVWAVGGAVRDALLGHPHLDWDLATNATPDDVRRVFGRKRTIPVGIDFGTVGVLDDTGRLHEVTTFRRDVRTDGRHAVVEFGASLEEDLARRDFTVNAIAYSPSKERIADPFGGRSDLQRRVIRAVGEPAERMREDRLRALRAIRFAARFGFEIDPPTWRALGECAPYLTRLSAERVKQELEKTMDQVRAPAQALRMWRDTGALQVLLPELVNASDAIAGLDFAAMPGPARRPGRRLTRFAVLFSDLSHAAALALTTRLRFSRQDSQWIARLAGTWAAIGEPLSSGLAGKAPPEDGTLRRWLAAIGRPQIPAFFRLAAARWAARHPSGIPAAAAAQAVHSVYRRSLLIAARDPLDIRDLAVDGDDLRQAGITPGPRLGKILAALLELVLDDPALNTRDRLLAEARRLNSGET